MPFFLLAVQRVLGGFTIVVQEPPYTTRAAAEAVLTTPKPDPTASVSEVLSRLGSEEARESFLRAWHAMQDHTVVTVVEAATAGEAQRQGEHEAYQRSGHAPPDQFQYFVMQFRSRQRLDQPRELHARVVSGPFHSHDDAAAVVRNKETQARWQRESHEHREQTGARSARIEERYCIVKAADEEQALRQEGIVLGPSMLISGIQAQLRRRSA